MLAVLESGVFAPLIGVLCAVFAYYLNFTRGKRAGRRLRENHFDPYDGTHVCAKCGHVICQPEAWQNETVGGQRSWIWYHQECPSEGRRCRQCERPINLMEESYEIGSTGAVYHNECGPRQRIEIVRPEDTFWLDVVGIPIDNWMDAHKPALGFPWGVLDPVKLTFLQVARDQGEFLPKPEPVPSGVIEIEGFQCSVCCSTVGIRPSPSQGGYKCASCGVKIPALSKQEIAERVAEKTGSIVEVTKLSHAARAVLDNGIYRDAYTGQYVSECGQDRSDVCTCDSCNDKGDWAQDPLSHKMAQLDEMMRQAILAPQLILSPEPMTIEPISGTHADMVFDHFRALGEEQRRQMIDYLTKSFIPPNPGIPRKRKSRPVYEWK